jgi:hypothetical protein
LDSDLSERKVWSQDWRVVGDVVDDEDEDDEVDEDSGKGLTRRLLAPRDG